MKLTGNLKEQVEKVETKDEKKSLIENAGMLLTDEEVETVSGGARDGGFYMSVGNCNGSYLALRPQPVWDQYHEIARLYPSYEVFTYGTIIDGTGVNGTPCKYRYVQYNGIWGYANAAFLY
jgi:hypothetical protein